MGEFLGYFYRDALDGDPSNKERPVSESKWASDVSRGLKEWYAKWESEKWRKRRESVRQMEKRRVRASGE
jgi:hypothetical protein